MADFSDPRRRLMLTAGFAGAGILLSSQCFDPAAAAEKSKRRGEENEVGAVEKSFLLYMRTFGPHCSETP